MSKGNKGLWNSSHKLLLLAAMAVATAIPLRAQTVYDENSSTGDLSSGAQLDAGSITLQSNGNSLFVSGGSRGTGTLILSSSNWYTGFVTTYGSIYYSSSAPGYVNFISVDTSSPSLGYPILSLTHEGTGTVTLNGSNINIYTGTTTISGGILQIGVPPPLNSGGTIQLTASTLTYSGYVPYSGTIVNGGILLLSSAAPTEPTTADEEEATTPTAPATLTLSAIPEPSTLGLLIVASLSAGLIRSRRKLK
ncbi:MAG: hypothetical protein B9S32_17420 [Verrucomicrobia bacterium Tous-C9LFEB]|nr:MAG: hypothetical protein B9S32_17420 [Verrucomicrobia bacterium Tous-C9LFEB]